MKPCIYEEQVVEEKDKNMLQTNHAVYVQWYKRYSRAETQIETWKIKEAKRDE